MKKWSKNGRITYGRSQYCAILASQRDQEALEVIHSDSAGGSENRLGAAKAITSGHVAEGSGDAVSRGSFTAWAVESDKIRQV